MLNFGLSLGRGSGISTPPPLPDWWQIDSLDEADIIGAFDYGWSVHNNVDDAITDFVHGLTSEVENGTPSLESNGLYFNGGSAIKFLLPDNTELFELTMIMQYEDAVKVGSLSALFGRYNDSNRYIFQLDFNNDHIRWSCGDGSANTIESSPNMTEGIVGVSGVELYRNGNYEGDAPDGGPVSGTGWEMRVGAAYIYDSLAQYSKFTANKLLVVKRKLTEAEHTEIVDKMNGGVITYENEVVTNQGIQVTY